SALAEILVFFSPISEELSSQDWAFQIMMIFCYLFTNIVMMNVLISLFSMTFIKGDDFWRSTWIECRLRYIESAENISYHIQGYTITTASPRRFTTRQNISSTVNAFYEKRKSTFSQDIISKPEQKNDGSHNGGNGNMGDDDKHDDNHGHDRHFNHHQHADSNDNSSTVQNKNHQGDHPHLARNDSSGNESHVRSYGLSRIESFHSDTQSDLSAIAATLAAMQRSIHELREPLTRRDPKIVAYERAQARDMVDQWISGRNEDQVDEPAAATTAAAKPNDSKM
ncbi:hypothetical protein BGZ65_007491, partial [Modicella reniformis]